MMSRSIKKAIPGRVKRNLADWINIRNRQKEFPFIKKFSKKNGIEIGGPSHIFNNQNEFPIYKLAKNVDGVNFSNNTVWEGKIKEGSNYKYVSDKTGHQYIGEASDLFFVSDCKYDFLLASHCLEHCANPVKTIFEWKRVIKDNGYLFLILPNKELTFDHKRSVTDFDHICEDYKNNIDETDLSHLDEILKLHDLSMDPPAGTPEQFRERSLKNYENRCLHHHVFDIELLKKIFLFAELKLVFNCTIGIHHVIVGAK